MKFSVVVKTSGGTEEKRVVDAPSRFAVYGLIEQEGATVVTIAEGGKGPSKLASIQFGSGVKTEERIQFAKNLAAMLGAGLTLSRALSVIERQTRNKYLRRIVADLEENVKAGKGFNEALELHQKVFSRLFISMTKAGEESGNLASSLKVVATQMDKSYSLQKKIKGAMIYPSIILVAIVIIGILMLIFVVPTLSSTFAAFGGKLPLITRIIMNSSDFVVHNVVAVIAGLLAFAAAGITFARSKFGKVAILWATLHMPVIGELSRETYAARAARTMGSLLSSGVEMLTALSITKEVVGVNVFGAIVDEAEERVRKGEQLSVAFANHPKLYPPLFSDMIAVGEETGKVADMLQQVAEYYETNVEDRTKDLSTIIEPLLMLFIGGSVGVFAIAMIGPIYSLSSKM